MTEGKAAERVVAECVRRRKPIPPPYDDPPTYPPGFGLFIRAFNYLSEERDPVPNGYSYIKTAAIRAWAREHGYAADADFMQELVAYVQALDRVWVPLKFKELNQKGNK